MSTQSLSLYMQCSNLNIETKQEAVYTDATALW